MGLATMPQCPSKPAPQSPHARSGSRDVRHGVVPALGRTTGFRERGNDTVSIWRWNLHAAVTALAISPLALGWSWGFPLPFIAHDARANSIEVSESAILP